MNSSTTYVVPGFFGWTFSHTGDQTSAPWTRYQRCSAGPSESRFWVEDRNRASYAGACHTDAGGRPSSLLDEQQARAIAASIAHGIVQPHYVVAACSTGGPLS